MSRMLAWATFAGLVLSASGATRAGPRAVVEFRDCAGCPQMAAIPSGTFEMGSAPGTVDGNGDESPVHAVTFAKGFAVGVNEVTRAEFEQFAKQTGLEPGRGCQVVRDEEWRLVESLSWDSPGFAQTRSDPVVCVSWREALDYVAWISGKAGKAYRLPREAEWEYLATRGSAGRMLSHDIANYGAEKCCANLVQGRDAWEYTAPVRSFPPDALGLYDVLGNVWEWVADCYTDSYADAPGDGEGRNEACMSAKRVVRGGSYGDGSALLRPAYRLRGPEDARYATLGFRVARDLD